MSFYNALSATSKVPEKLAHIVNSMAFDQEHPKAKDGDGTEATGSPAESEEEKEIPEKTDGTDAMEDNDGGFQEVEEQEMEGFQIVGGKKGNSKEKTEKEKKENPSGSAASSKGQGIGTGKVNNVKKEKFEKRHGSKEKSEDGGDSEDSNKSGASAKARKAAKQAGLSAAVVETQPPAGPQHVFLEADERLYLTKCCTEESLLEDPSYVQSLDLLLAKYAIDKDGFVKAVSGKDDGYFSRILIGSAEPYPVPPAAS